MVSVKSYQRFNHDPIQCFYTLFNFDLIMHQSIGRNILFPTSTLASTFLEKALHERGFHVTRLNVYDTIPSLWSRDETVEALNADIVAFASPSAVRSWVNRVGSHYRAVCMGPTTFREAQRLNLRNITYCSTSKGIDPWIELISQAAAATNLHNMGVATL